MRVWTTTIGQRLDSAENTRTMLLCHELLGRGHEVTLWTSAYDHVRKCWRAEWLASPDGMVTAEGLQIRFLKGCGYRSNVSLRRLIDHGLAAREFRRKALTVPPPDVIVASLPDHMTAAAAVEFGRSVGAACLVDVRDKWPAVFIDLARGRILKGLAATALFLETRRTRIALQKATSLVAMMRSMMTWGLSVAGRDVSPDDRIFYLTTTPKNFGPGRERYEIAEELRATLDSLEGKRVFTYVGTFNRTQHPALLLDALDILADRENPQMREAAFLIGGDGAGADAVARRAAAFPNVHMLGWLSTGAMLEALASSDVGLLLMNFRSPAFNNKAFAYLASGLPIINGATGDLADLIDEHDIGVNVQAGDAGALANAIADILAAPQGIDRQQTNVRKLFDAQFDRETNYAAYADHVETMARRVAEGAGEHRLAQF